MKTFKEQLDADLTDVFLNEEEFADKHTVEGVEIVCIIDSYQGTHKSNGSQFSIAECDQVLMTKTTALNYSKEAGELLNVDGREWTVNSWDDQSGLTVIGLLAPVTA